MSEAAPAPTEPTNANTNPEAEEFKKLVTEISFNLKFP
jgi:hypothetical protein